MDKGDDLMNSHNREPIAHTCPNIDKLIRQIKRNTYSDRQLKQMDYDELFKIASDMSSELENCVEYFEEIRKSNETLRNWGIEEAEKVDQLEQYVPAGTEN